MSKKYTRLGMFLGVWALSVLSAQAATITVTSSADAGAGTLRQALADANSGDTVNFSFSSPTVITLASELTISRSLTLVGPGASLLTISGNDSVRVVNVTGGTSTIFGLTLSHGSVTDINGAGIYIAAGTTLTLDQCAITNNNALISAFGGPPATYGGGIFND